MTGVEDKYNSQGSKFFMPIKFVAALLEEALFFCLHRQQHYSAASNAIQSEIMVLTFAALPLASSCSTS